MRWKILIDSAEARALDLCLGSMNSGNGNGCGFSKGCSNDYIGQVARGSGDGDGSDGDYGPSSGTPDNYGSGYGYSYFNGNGGSSKAWS